MHAVTELTEPARSVGEFDKMHKSAGRQGRRSDGKSGVLSKAHHRGCTSTETPMEEDHPPFP